MRPSDFDNEMRKHECFHNQRVVPGAHIIVRVDGVAFHTVTKGLDKPFCAGLHKTMLETAATMLEKLGGVYAYTQSDEISVLLPKDTELYDRQAEKLVSVAASHAAVCVMLGFMRDTLESDVPWSVRPIPEVAFDARLWIGTSDSDVIDYFRWRQEDAARNCALAHRYWALRRSGMSPARCASTLSGVSHKQLLDGLDLGNVPSWQLLGVGVRREYYSKQCVNKKTGEPTVARRRRTVFDSNLPRRDDYSTYIWDRLGEDCTR